MAIVKMKKLRVMAMMRQRDELLRQLQHLGCVEISEPDRKLADPAWSNLLRRDDSQLVTIRSKIADLNTAMAGIKRFAEVKEGMLTPRRTISEKELLSPETVDNAEGTSQQINQSLRELSRLQSEESRLSAKRASLLPWRALDMPLEMERTQHTVLYLAVCPSGVPEEELAGALAGVDASAELFFVNTDRQQHYLMLICYKDDQDAVLEALRPAGFSVTSFQGITGTAEQNIETLDRQIIECQKAQRTEEETIASCAQQWDALKTYADRLRTEENKQANIERLMTNGTILFFEGWAPENKMVKVSLVLDRLECAWESSDPTEDEYPDVPVELENNAFTRPLNMVTDMYSLPAYNGVDPNSLMAIFFILFYGMMMADMGYGLVMIAAAVYVIKKVNPNGPTMRHMMPLMGYCGISTFIWGAVTGGFFGDFLTQFVLLTTGGDFALPALFSPLDDAVPVLIGSLVLGLTQVFVGMGVSVFLKFKRGQILDAICNECAWYAVFGLAGIAALGVLPVNITLVLIVIMLVATQVVQGVHEQKGVAGIIVGIGGSLYNNITGYFSDILSYSRLMALMLAGAVVAQVFNQLGAMTGNVITFILIAIIGNALNFALNILGCYVHDMRLQCLEFFGRFYEDGGKNFRPLAVLAQNVDIVRE